MFDLVVRDGLVFDGTGAAPFAADIGVIGDRIAEVGPGIGRGRQELHADGRAVTPGFVDVHTHYDGQATWDPLLEPSSRHGVTTAVVGNCGVGFAPVRPGGAEFLIDLMEGVEEIPGAALAEGVDFSWETFPEYLSVLERRPRVLDVGAYLPHSALRTYVMGAEGQAHEAEPDGAQVEEMARLLREALDAGAIGLATSRTLNHRIRGGRHIPTLSSGRFELLGLAAAFRGGRTGLLQVVSDCLYPELLDPQEEIPFLEEIGRTAGRPVSVTAYQVHEVPDVWREVLRLLNDANARGVTMTAQVAPRAIGLLCGLQCSLSPFSGHPTYRRLADLPLAERVAALRRADVRAAILSERPGSNRFANVLFESLDRITPLGVDRLDYEPAPSSTIAALARVQGRPAAELLYDLLLEDEGRTLFYYPMHNYATGDLSAVREMLLDPCTVPGLGDGGAHVTSLCDASFPTFLLSHWGKDRTRGPGLPLEFLVQQQTSVAADAVGLGDRGRIRVGARADLNVIDLDALALRRPRIVHDLPAGGRRLVQDAEGYAHTICAGVETFRDGEHTGALPGRLARPLPAGSTS